MAKNVKSEQFIEIGVVSDLLDTTLPTPELLEFYRRLDKREILWNCAVDESMIELSMYILKWNTEDKGLPVKERKPIKIFINSEGGDLNTVLNLIDVIRLSKTPVHTIGLGMAYSAAGYLLMAGHKRYIFENTSFLIHDGYSGAFGSIAKNIDTMRFTERGEERVKNLVLSCT